MEFILFGAGVWFWILALILVILLITAEVRENGFIAFFGFVAFCTAIYYWGSFDLTAIKQFLSWKVIAGYLGVGFIFTLFRIFLFGKKNRKKLEKLKSEYPTPKDQEDYSFKQKEEDLLRPMVFKAHVFRWWFNWPGSLTWWILQDFLRSLGDLVYDTFKKLFLAVYDAGMKA